MTSPRPFDTRANATAGAVQEAKSSWAAPFEPAPEEMLPFDVAIDAIEAALRFGIDPSLEPVQKLLAELGHPEASFACVQVAGTNGKTSTSRYAAALFRGEGLRCGLYTSPHLVDYTERMEVDGHPVCAEAFARGVSWALSAWRRLCAHDAACAARGCTEFELLTAAAMVVYAEAGVDMAVLEVGLGGRWDATSAVPTVGCAITGIGLDHMAILGDDLASIAREKAAVIHRGGVCVLGTNAVRPSEVLAVMERRCRHEGVIPTMVGLPAGEAPRGAHVDFCVDQKPCGLDGQLVFEVRGSACDAGGGEVPCGVEDLCLVAPAYQAQNAACAVALVSAVLGRQLDSAHVRASLASCPVPGRFEVARRKPLAILDACHNPQSAQAFGYAVEAFEPLRERRPLLLLGALADKDHRGIVEAIAPLFDRIAVTQSLSERAYPACDLAMEVEELVGRPVEAIYPDAASAVEALENEAFIGCGTITLVGELKALLRSVEG